MRRRSSLHSSMSTMLISYLAMICKLVLSSFNAQESVGFQGIMVIVVHTIWKNKSCAFYTMQHWTFWYVGLIPFAFLVGSTDKNHWKVMNWVACLKICLGVTHAFAYLHASSLPKIIHRDIKASNIFLLFLGRHWTQN